MVATTLSLPSHTFMMDDSWIEPIYLSQVFLAIYESKTVTKMHLLTNVKHRSDSKGICSGEFAAMLLLDFVKSREKEDSPTRTRETVQSKTLASGSTKEKQLVSSLNRDEDNYGTTIRSQDLFKSTKKSDQDFGTPGRPMTDRKQRTQGLNDLDWSTPKETFSERKPKTQQEIKKEQKLKMMYAKSYVGLQGKE